MPSDSPTPLLSVRGEATLEVPPEIVQLTITVSARGPNREHVLEQLAKRNDECLSILKGYGDAVEKIASSGLAIYPELRSGRREQVKAYRGTVRIDVTVVDFGVLGELVVRVSDNDLTTLSGPWWRLRPDSPVHRRVRQDAARDAIVRAHEYAEAVGASLTGLVELSDEGLTSAGQPHTRSAPMAYAAAPMRGGVAAEPPPIDMEPQPQLVHARVEARFTMSPPDRL
jgi:uncharacterized protein YggE